MVRACIAVSLFILSRRRAFQRYDQSAIGRIGGELMEFRPLRQLLHQEQIIIGTKLG
jgi:hypothetical protein